MNKNKHDYKTTVPIISSTGRCSHTPRNWMIAAMKFAELPIRRPSARQAWYGSSSDNYCESHSRLLLEILGIRNIFDVDRRYENLCVTALVQMIIYWMRTKCGIANLLIKYYNK